MVTRPPCSWYPVSAMKGDGQSKGLINAWLGAPIAKVRAGPAKPPLRVPRNGSQKLAAAYPCVVRHAAAACLQDVFKNRLDSGMAQSIFESERRLSSMAAEQYTHMKKLQSRLEWGYKVVDNEIMCVVCHPSAVRSVIRRDAFRPASHPGTAPHNPTPMMASTARRAKEAAGEIEKQKIVPVTKDMISTGNIFDQAKKAFNL